VHVAERAGVAVFGRTYRVAVAREEACVDGTKAIRALSGIIAILGAKRVPTGPLQALGIEERGESHLAAVRIDDAGFRTCQLGVTNALETLGTLAAAHVHTFKLARSSQLAGTVAVVGGAKSQRFAHVVGRAVETGSTVRTLLAFVGANGHAAASRELERHAETVRAVLVFPTGLTIERYAFERTGIAILPLRIGTFVFAVGSGNVLVFLGHVHRWNILGRRGFVLGHGIFRSTTGILGSHVLILIAVIASPAPAT